MLQAVTELWGQFYQGGNSMEKVGWQVPEPCFAWVWDSGLPSWWSPALVEMNISDFQHLTWYYSCFSLLILRSVKFRSVILLWNFGTESPVPRINSQLQFYTDACPRKNQTHELTDCSVPKEPSCSLCHNGTSHQEESELNSQSGFPTEPTTQNAHGEKKIEFWDAVESLTSCWDVKMA